MVRRTYVILGLVGGSIVVHNVKTMRQLVAFTGLQGRIDAGVFIDDEAEASLVVTTAQVSIRLLALIARLMLSG